MVPRRRLRRYHWRRYLSRPEAHLDWGEHYDDVHSTAPDKPVALAECDIVPHPDDVPEDHPFVWFLPWHTSLIRANDEEYIREIYNHPYALTASDLPEL